MKKLIILLVLIPFFYSCNQKKVKDLESLNENLAQQTFERDQTINDFLTAINDIQTNLDSIKAREMIITDYSSSTDEVRKNVQTQINDDINSIYELLLDSRAKLDETRKKLGRSDYQLKEMEKMLSRLATQLEEKDKEIAELHQELERLNVKITGLAEDISRLSKESQEKSAYIEDQTRQIEDKTLELHAAYFIVGNRKDLLDKNIITREGGFIGIGRSRQLKPDFDEALFTRIDIRDVKTISIPGRKADVVTTHPSESYTISGEDDGRILTVLNFEEFWKSSKHLVVVVQ